MANLVIVESPAKCTIISKYLNASAALKHYGKFVVMASVGHIRDLIKKKLGIDVDGNFEPEYAYLEDKKKVIDGLKKAAKGAKTVWLATDADLEATFIAESLRLALGLGEKYHRIVFTEITPRALEQAVLNPVRIDQDGLESQQCRRILDRLVGFKLSPLLWKKFTMGGSAFSAGRVQSALLHLIIEREKEIEAFESTPYWHVMGDFDLDGRVLEAVRMYEKDTIWKTSDPKQIPRFFKSLKNKWSIHNLKSRAKKENPDPPFITSSLQQEGSSKLRVGVKRVMQLAQGLYEAGHITYMRTDSYNMSEDFKAAGREVVLNRWGDAYYEGGVLRKKAIKGAQEAHECIRPTRAHVEEISELSEDHRELYKLIWKRSIAFLMKPAVYDELEIKFRDVAMSKEREFVTIFKKVKFNGYLAVYGIAIDKEGHGELATMLKEGRYRLTMRMLAGKNTWTSPPSRYNDAGLVKLMEQNGIGRPSTMVTIIEKLYERTYIVKTDIKGVARETLEYEWRGEKVQETKGTVEVGSEKAKAKPTDVGSSIDGYLSSHFSYIVDKSFTAMMEADLDKIAVGDKRRLDVLKAFWGRFSVDLDKEVVNKVAKTKIATESKKVVCDGIVYTVRIAKYGPVLEHGEEKKSYIGLKAYLKLTKKEYLDVDASDIAFLKALPRQVGSYEGKEVRVNLGPYGLYLQHEGKNYGCPIKNIQKLEELNDAQIKKFIEYKKST